MPLISTGPGSSAGRIEPKPSNVLQVLFEGRAPDQSPDYLRYQKLMRWADQARRLGVRANADQADQAMQAIKLGAEGIGLCRTEHMFFGEQKIGPMRRAILADEVSARRSALDELLVLQRQDFEALFETCGGGPVTIRTLDPPLHEFLPRDEQLIAELAQSMSLDPSHLTERVESMHESNPMLGHRGCRLGITQPDITAMQVRAILEAALAVAARGTAVHPEIMIPLVAYKAELDSQLNVVHETADQVFAEQGKRIAYQVGTMIELPRAALAAAELARSAEFFSFGTNDLTQTTLGMSRDDIRPVLTRYQELGLIARSPFQSIDESGVGELIEIALRRGREARPELETGICGEHGGDPDSVTFCHRAGLDYVSCSPFRLPVARLAAAQAALAERDPHPNE